MNPLASVLEEEQAEHFCSALGFQQLLVIHSVLMAECLADQLSWVDRFFYALNGFRQPRAWPEFFSGWLTQGTPTANNYFTSERGHARGSNRQLTIT
ncbi:MAG: hypothetical protein VKJ31_03125 [Synechococcus sp.]|nr:hypothetical protein [Synechococcus sp.]